MRMMPIPGMLDLKKPLAEKSEQNPLIYFLDGNDEREHTEAKTYVQHYTQGEYGEHRYKYSSDEVSLSGESQGQGKSKSHKDKEALLEAWYELRELVKEHLKEGFDLIDVDLSWSDLSNLNLENANLYGANLTGSNLFKTNLSKAILKDAVLDR